MCQADLLLISWLQCLEDHFARQLVMQDLYTADTLKADRIFQRLMIQSRSRQLSASDPNTDWLSMIGFCVVVFGRQSSAVLLLLFSRSWKSVWTHTQLLIWQLHPVPFSLRLILCDRSAIRLWKAGSSATDLKFQTEDTWKKCSTESSATFLPVLSCALRLISETDTSTICINLFQTSQNNFCQSCSGSLRHKYSKCVGDRTSLLLFCAVCFQSDFVSDKFRLPSQLWLIAYHKHDGRHLSGCRCMHKNPHRMWTKNACSHSSAGVCALQQRIHFAALII